MKRIISIFLAVSMMITYIPFGEIVVFAVTPGATISRLVVNTDIRLIRNGEGVVIGDDVTQRIEIRGSGFGKQGIPIITRVEILYGGDEALGNTISRQSEGLIEVSLSEGTNIEFGKSYEVKLYTKDNTNPEELVVKGNLQIGKALDIDGITEKYVSEGETFNILGSGFDDPSQIKVKVGTNAAYSDVTPTNASDITSTEIKNIKVPSGKGTKNVRVSREVDGKETVVVTLLGELEVISSGDLKIAQIMPNAGSVKGGTEVRIIGIGLNGDTEVYFGGIKAQNLGIDKSTDVGDDKSIIKVITPPRDGGQAGVVDVEVKYTNLSDIKAGGFRYIIGTSSPIIDGLRPNSGTTGTLVTIEGKNFQDTKVASGKKISAEDGITLKKDSEDVNKIIAIRLEKNNVKHTPPGKSTEGTYTRYKDMTVSFGGHNAEFQVSNSASTGPGEYTYINPDPQSEYQYIVVKVPIIPGLENDQKVPVEINVTTSYMDSQGQLVDVYTETHHSPDDFLYEVTKSNPELKLVSTNGNRTGVPEIEQDNINQYNMATGTPGASVYLYGTDFRSDAKVYFFEEGKGTLEEILNNQAYLGEVLNSQIVGNGTSKLEVKVPDIKKLGPVTVLVVNKDGGRTKTILELTNDKLEENKNDTPPSYELTDIQKKQIELVQFNYKSAPKITKVDPKFGGTSKGEEKVYPRVSIKGEMFLLDKKEGETGISSPEIYVIPNNMFSSDVKLEEIESKKVGLTKYKVDPETIEISFLKDKIYQKLDGQIEKIGTRITASFPSLIDNERGLKDIIIINPDGGFTIAEDAFEYKVPTTKPIIEKVNPEKGTVEGGEKIIVEGSGFEYGRDPRDIKVIVTIDGELAKIENVERLGDGTTQRITITTPPGTVGNKKVQVINPDGGTGEGDFEYTIVKTGPKITKIAPNFGSAKTIVTIKGDDFILPEDNKLGTRVFLGEEEYEVGKNGDGLGANGQKIEFGEVKVVDKQTIVITIPSGLPIGPKKVKVVNPDSAYTIGKELFNYLIPEPDPDLEGKPIITTISPDSGSYKGGSIVRIKGEGFSKNAKVFFQEQEGLNVKVNGEGTELEVITPSYPLDPAKESEKSVLVTIINPDGRSSGEKMKADEETGEAKYAKFTFKIPESNPKITKVDPEKGTTVGNQMIIIEGEDFRQFYRDNEGNIKKGLPEVYFGGSKSQYVDFSSANRLIVTTPAQKEGGPVDVIVVNPDAGTAISKNGFTYEISKPTITSITPNIIQKDGGTAITIKGTEFISNKHGETADIEAIFGNESKKDTVTGGKGEVTIGNIQVKYNSTDTSTTNNITVFLSGVQKEIFRLDSANPKLIKLATGESTHLEGIKIELVGSDLVVTRRLATVVKYIDENTLEVITPPMDGVGERDIIIRNRDGGEAKQKISVKNSASNPRITNIEPKIENHDINDVLDFYSIESTAEGNTTFTIYGSDFRTGVKVLIGDQEAQILSKGPNDDNLVVRSPKGKTDDIDKKLIITVLNEDGGVVASNDAEKTKVGNQEKQVYYIYRHADSAPTVTKIDPNVGSIKGGEKVTITGNDFRPEQIEVKFGGKLASVLKNESRYDKLVVITPEGDMVGKVDVHIKNTKALGEIVVKDGYTYISSPTILRIDPDRVKNNGEHKVTIKGSGFMEGVKVSIGDLGDIAIGKLELKDSQTIEVTISPKVEMDPREESIFKNITIENTDGGTYTLKNCLEIIHPIPEDPSGFRANAGHERSVTLTWDKVGDAERYKIFGSKSGKRSDYEFLGETTDLKYIVKDLDPDTRYYFRLWTLNKYGESINYDYADTRTLRKRDDDGNDKYNIDTESRDKTIVSYIGGEISINLADKYNYSQYYQDLSDIKYSNYKNIRISIPINVAKSFYGNVQIKTKDILLDIPLNIFNDSTYYRQQDDTNIIVNLSKLDSQEKGRITKGIERNEAVLENAYEIKFEMQNEKSITPITLRGSASLTVYTDKSIPNTNNVFIGRYAPESNNLIRNISTVSYYTDYMTNKETYAVYSSINATGKYAIIYIK